MMTTIAIKSVFLSDLTKTTLHYEVSDSGILGQWFPTWGLSPP